MTDSWLEIACDVPEEHSEVVADFLTSLSGNGVCVDNLCLDAFSQSEIPDSVRVVIKAYLPADSDPSHKMNITNELISVKGVKHCELVLTTTGGEDLLGSYA